MKIFISGGAKNGKSMFAQTCAKRLANENHLWYLATMEPHDGEDDARNCAKLYLAYVNGESQVRDQDIPDYIKTPFSHSVIYEGHANLSGDILVKDLSNADVRAAIARPF